MKKLTVLGTVITLVLLIVIVMKLLYTKHIAFILNYISISFEVMSLSSMRLIEHEKITFWQTAISNSKNFLTNTFSCILLQELLIPRFGDNAKAIYQHKLSKAYIYYVIQDNGFEGWVAGPDKDNDNTFEIKISHKYENTLVIEAGLWEIFI